MIANLLTDNYVKNIPWMHNPRNCFKDDDSKYKEAFQNVLEYIPNTNDLISFQEDVWDFNPYYQDINSSSYRINFTKASKDYVDYLKFFVIYKITKKSKIPTIELRTQNFIYIISTIKQRHKNKSFSLITTNDIIEYIENRDVSSTSKHSLYVAAYTIYEVILKNYDITLFVDVNLLKERAVKEKKISKQENNKLPNIPEDYYSIILNKAIEVLNDESANFNRRMTAGLIIIESQTGLRTQDLIGLKKDALSEKKLPVSKVTCHYLHFQTRKPSKAHSNMLEFDIYASQLCAEAFNKMKELRTACKYSNEPYLYVLDETLNSKNEYPIIKTRLISEYKRFFYTELKEESNNSWKGINPTSFYYAHNKSVKLNIPTIPQFRVHLATALYNNGVSLTYIQKYLAHLSEYMMGYYVRPKNSGHENAKFAENVVKKIAGDDMTPLGRMGEEIKENLKKFIKEGHYNVQSDASKILNDLGEKLVIREKGPGLCCIKTSIIPCKYDARTDKMLCAFGMCPNIFHFYDMINVTYMQFQELQNTYQQNKDNGFQRAAEKELNKLKSFCEGRLVPELNELEKVVNKMGLDEFTKKHPDLQYYARNVSNIRKEIQIWVNY